jgi:hypothetical protein
MGYLSIRIGQHHLPGNDLLCHVESDVLLWLDPKLLLLVGGEGSKRSKDMRSLDPHVSIIVDNPDEAAQFPCGSWER